MSMQQMLLASATTSLKVGLQSWWELGEASGNRLDSIGGRSMVPNGTVTQVAGLVGNAAQTSVSAYLKTSTSPVLHTGDFTIAGVFKTSATVFGVMSRNGAAVGSNRQWLIVVDTPSSTLYFAVSTNGTSNAAFVTGPTGMNNNAFHDYIAWRDTANNTINLQVDGGSVLSSAMTGSTALYSAVDPGIYLSGIGTEAAYLTGGVHDQVGIWNRMLSSTERTFLRNSGAWRSFADL